MNLHVFRTPQEKKHWSVGGGWEAPWRFADDYHVFGLDRGKDEIKFYVDGLLVRSVENTHWHQPLFLIFDSKTMPEWFGMPDDKDLPSTFSVEYVRAWKMKVPACEQILAHHKRHRHNYLTGVFRTSGILVIRPRLYVNVAGCHVDEP